MIDTHLNPIDESFGKSISKLIHYYPFYGYLLSKVTRRERTDIPTMQVELNLHSGELTLAYNKEFMMSLTYAERLYVLQHEILHLSEGHLFYKVSDREIFNIAADLVVNQILNKIFTEKGKPNSVSMPKGAIDINDPVFSHLKKDESTMYYYEALLEDCKKDCKKREQITGKTGIGEFVIVTTPPEGKSGSQVYVHGQTISDQDLQRLEEVVKSKLEESAAQSAGNVPAEISRGIISKKRVSQINWKTALNNFLKNTLSNIRRVNRNRQARNNPYSYPTRANKQHNILIGLDVSGSVSDADVSVFLAEMQNMHSNKNCNITLIQCDTAIASVTKYKGENSITRSATGGTMLDPIVDYYDQNKKDFDGVIIVTDGYFSLTNKLIEFKPCLWLFFERNQMIEKINPKQSYFIHNK